MNDPIVLTIPDDISDRARQIAASAALPVEQVLLDYLKTLPVTPALPADVQAELNALHFLSDDALWAMAREQMPEDVQARAGDLMDKNTRGAIGENERTELEQLVERGDRLMLRKAEAAAILRERGFTFRQQDFNPAHE